MSALRACGITSPLVSWEDSGEGPGSGVDPMLEAMVEEEEDF